MELFRNQFEHHWIIEMTDEGINEAETYFKDFFNKSKALLYEIELLIDSKMYVTWN